MPKISVVTSVYNCEEYIRETIESVLNQDFNDWEFILIDDCSKDKSAEIIKSYSDKDSRVIYVRNETNQGQPANLNTAIRLAKGKYIARLDHDDICAPERFSKQYQYMEEHPDVVLLGSCNSELMNGLLASGKRLCETDSDLRFLAAFGIQDIIHSCFFIRKQAMLDNNIWYRDYDYAEDYGLYGDMLAVGNVHVINENLVTYRIFDGNTTSKTSPELRYNEMTDIIFRYLDSLKISDSGIVKNALKGGISAEHDFDRLMKWVIAYAKYCGLSENETEIKKSKYVRFAFYNLIIWQQGNIDTWKFYRKSGINYGLSNMKLEMKMLKHCIIHNKKRLLWYSGKETLEQEAYPL